ncbi:MAG: sigma-70 family RNA polymerase sigma factor [Bacteroidota bacterium]
MVKEKRIIQLLHRKDKRAIAIIYDQYAPSLYGVIVRIVRSEELAEDVLQEAFIKIWKSAERYDAGKARLFTWLLNIARNAAIDATRSAHFKHTTTNGDGSYINGHHQPSTEINVNHIGVKKIVNGLEGKYREVIDLIYFGGYTQAEVAETLNIPLGTVKTRVKIAMRELRKIFCNSTVSSFLLLISILSQHG